jgi:hypothetical protein
VILRTKNASFHKLWLREARWFNHSFSG